MDIENKAKSLLDAPFTFVHVMFRFVGETRVAIAINVIKIWEKLLNNHEQI